MIMQNPKMRWLNIGLCSLFLEKQPPNQVIDARILPHLWKLAIDMSYFDHNHWELTLWNHIYDPIGNLELKYDCHKSGHFSSDLCMRFVGTFDKRPCGFCSQTPWMVNCSLILTVNQWSFSISVPITRYCYTIIHCASMALCLGTTQLTLKMID